MTSTDTAATDTAAVNSTAGPDRMGGWEVGHRAQYLARISPAPDRFLVVTGPVERVSADGLTVRWDWGGAGRFTPDELHLLTREGSPAAHRAVFGAAAHLPGDLLDLASDARGHTIADEVMVETWEWDESGTETLMVELVDIAARAGVWGRWSVGLMIVPDYDDPAWCVVSLALPGRFRFAAEAVELRDLLGPDHNPDTGPDTGPDGTGRRLRGRELGEAVLAGVTATAVTLVAQATCLDLPVLNPRYPTETGNGSTETAADAQREGVRGDG